MAKKKKKGLAGLSTLLGLVALMSKGQGEVGEDAPIYEGGELVDSTAPAFGTGMSMTDLLSGDAVYGEDRSNIHETINWELEKEKYPEAIKNHPLLKMLVEKDYQHKTGKYISEVEDYDILDIVRGLHEPEQLTKDISSAITFMDRGRKSDRAPGQEGDIISDWVGQQINPDEVAKNLAYNAPGRDLGKHHQQIRASNILSRLINKDSPYWQGGKQTGYDWIPTLEEREELGY